MIVTTWMLAVAAMGAAVLMGLQWVLHRSLQRQALDVLRARHLQLQLESNRKLEQAKRQVGQLQAELALARLEVRQCLEREAPPAVPTREQLLRQLDAAPIRRAVPVDGFADTLPSEQYAHMEELMTRVRV